ncbi:hypothetical protein HKT18_05055 [Flavobacterium sp. IMCC34852]|uniref:Uncharacterized protein n=1 Tax=Flavobacterium rivulicola TaxID=2732161 RepID=A0A7Y3VYI8_9FLAO|nr:hypothetical protein [Flavobacterium sp. IMCC34852]NNT71582.1 hypothetical protein [Flavobacterium sp. IMCC34852]
MDKIRLILVSLFLISCNYKHNNDDKILAEDSMQVIKNDAIVLSDRMPSLTKKWIQYKKVPTINQLDTLPYRDCYITISGEVFSYFKEGKLVEKRTLIRDRNFKYEVYNFRENPDDYLQYLDIKGKKVVLKRDNYEGEQEYFILTDK